MYGFKIARESLFMKRIESQLETWWTRSWLSLTSKHSVGWYMKLASLCFCCVSSLKTAVCVAAHGAFTVFIFVQTLCFHFFHLSAHLFLYHYTRMKCLPLFFNNVAVIVVFTFLSLSFSLYSFCYRTISHCVYIFFRSVLSLFYP